MTDQLAQVLESYNAAECGNSKLIQESNSLREGYQLATGMMCSFPMFSDCELVVQELNNISENLNNSLYSFYSFNATCENYKFIPSICVVLIYIIK